MAEIMNECAKPGCTTEVSIDKAFGSVNIELERRREDEEYRDLAVDVWGEICSNCSNDLADWWLSGKK